MQGYRVPHPHPNPICVALVLTGRVFDAAEAVAPEPTHPPTTDTDPTSTTHPSPHHPLTRTPPGHLYPSPSPPLPLPLATSTVSHQVRLGLVTRIAEDPLEEARRLAREISARSPDATAAAKRLTHATYTEGCEEARALALALTLTLSLTLSLTLTLSP